MRSLGKALRAVRVVKGMSLDQVAKECGLSTSYIGRLERDERDPTWSTLKAICGALGVPVSTIAMLSEPNQLNQNTVATAQLLID